MASLWRSFKRYRTHLPRRDPEFLLWCVKDGYYLQRYLTQESDL